MFSRLLISKGVYDYLNAAKQTLSMGYKCNFLLAGSILNNDGYVDPTIIDKFCDDDVIEYVNFTDDVLSLLKSCHCVVLPTYYPEGTPKSLLEAGACGKAIITTNTSGCRDVVIDGENGFLCNIKSPEDLSKAMVNYLELTIDKKLSFSKRSHEHVRHNYSDSMIIDSYLRIIDS
jgi:glycosyltransferase involved in cell wall biosynthesis